MRTKKSDWKKTSRSITISDGLGICRSCAQFDPHKYPTRVQVGSTEYFESICQGSNLPCYRTRESLLTCRSICLHKKPKTSSLIQRLIKCFKENNWKYLRGDR